MNALDLGILIVLLADVTRGARIGFARQFFGFAGFWGGLFVAAMLSPAAARFGDDPLTKAMLIIGTALVVAVTLSALGELLGARLAQLVDKLKIHHIDGVLGAIFGVVLVSLSVWLLSAMLFSMPNQALRDQIQNSKIIQALSSTLPPAPPIISRIERLIDPAGFPKVFIGPEPNPGAVDGGATPAEVAQAVAADGISTVQIKGLGCGGELFGSGFISSPNVVVTNAHVVAGINRPLVLDRNGPHSSIVILFNPDLDLAVLRTNGLVGPALPINEALVPDGTHSVALGYPGGGSFKAAPAAVIQNYVATGRNIYNSGITARRVYEILADIQHGNSGGPLVLPDGTVIGVIFARSEASQQIGYALTSRSILPELEKATTNRTAVSSGKCAAE